MVKITNISAQLIGSYQKLIINFIWSKRRTILTKITLVFNGYWTSATALPSYGGIYCVYAGKKTASGVVLNRLMYAGESVDINNRVSNHEKEEEWRSFLKYGEILIFSAAKEIYAPNREQGEAAIIHRHKPPVNIEHKYSFRYNDTHMELSGETALLDTSFIVRNTTRSTTGWANTMSF